MQQFLLHECILEVLRAGRVQTSSHCISSTEFLCCAEHYLKHSFDTASAHIACITIFSSLLCGVQGIQVFPFVSFVWSYIPLSFSVAKVAKCLQSFDQVSVRSILQAQKHPVSCTTSILTFHTNPLLASFLGLLKVQNCLPPKTSKDLCKAQHLHEIAQAIAHDHFLGPFPSRSAPHLSCTRPDFLRTFACISQPVSWLCTQGRVRRGGDGC